MPSSNPYPKMWTPPPPEGLRESLETALNEEERAFPRALAIGTLVYRLNKWFEGFVSYCEPRGGTYGMKLEAIKQVIAEREETDEGVVNVYEPQDDGSVLIRQATPQEAEDLAKEIARFKSQSTGGPDQPD